MSRELKENQIDAILKRTREVLENAELVRSCRIIIDWSTEEATTIDYDIDEYIIDWEIKE